ncbi:MAG: HzsA-related protein [Planctomycetota bacterium]|jgi:hypothetical protein
MMTYVRRARPALGRVGLMLTVTLGFAASAAGQEAGGRSEQDDAMLGRLDAPLLFVKRFNYLGLHIYDTYYKWRPGGGIYVIENPSAPAHQQKIRPLIDPSTPETLGEGVYSDPDISYDGRRVLFCFKSEQAGSTSIYEIGVDGKGLRRLTDPRSCCDDYKGSHGGQHDVSPAYLPDGRIVFTSTRPSGLVPCANSGVDILHVMNADGSGMHPISVNNVNEFDPCVLPDGRIIHGRWEYVDKTALTQQSLWTIFPDGTGETALFANNMVHPEAVLDARPVPGASHLIAGSFTPHNAPPRGTVAVINTRLGKNDPGAIVNFDSPDDPSFDRGESCEPWPLSEDLLLYSGRPEGDEFNAVMMIDGSGRKVVVYRDPGIDCHSPMLIKPRWKPPALSSTKRPGAATGRFLVQDVYRGLTGVKRGEVKWLRVIEETSRVSSTPGGAYNQTFLVSAALAFSVKNFLGVVPVEPDGSAYFEVPSGRALYLQALDAEGRLVQSMRTFVQAAPGVTRSCVGCHEYKYSAPPPKVPPLAMDREPDRPMPESWGTGFIDYPSMVQPILDRHCVKCHGGEEGIAAGVDLSSGWTEHFNISYENLVNRRETQVTASLIAGIDCMNGTSLWSAQILSPRSHGSGAAPLAEVLASGHDGYIPDLARTERDLLMAWIDTNGLYHGTWDYTEHGCGIKAWAEIRQALVAEMRTAGCTQCHHVFESDWINLQRPELSRVLRGPLPEDADGWGLGLCRNRKLDPRHQRIRLLVGGAYIHAVRPVETFRVPEIPSPETEGEPVAPLASTDNPHYQTMLAVIQDGRRQALAAPRVDMPGAVVQPGACRRFLPTPLPRELSPLAARVDREGIVRLAWERSARTIGLSAEVHRGQGPGFTPDANTLLTTTSLFQYDDPGAEPGPQHYAVVLCSVDDRSLPIRASLDVPELPPPPAPGALEATPAPGRVQLQWRGGDDIGLRFHVYRAAHGADRFERLTPEPTPRLRHADVPPAEGVPYAYTVRAVNRRGAEGPAAGPIAAAAKPEIKDPVFDVALAENAHAKLYPEGTAPGALHGKARVADGLLDLAEAGHVAFAHRAEFDLDRPLSIECWVRMTKEGGDLIPVVVSCGHWQRAGWFLQRIGAGWRWHVGGIDCDGGEPAPGRWTHLIGTFDGHTTRLFQDGKLVAERAGAAVRAPYRGPFLIGYYSGERHPRFQVTGQISGVKIYNRALRADDALRAFEAGR